MTDGEMRATLESSYHFLGRPKQKDKGFSKAEARAGRKMGHVNRLRK